MFVVGAAKGPLLGLIAALFDGVPGLQNERALNTGLQA